MAAKGAVDFDHDICKGCGLCVDCCPVDMLAMDEHSINVKGYHPAQVIHGREDDCIACVRCVDMCPDLVITVTKF